MIKNLTLLEQSALFAKMSSYCYNNLEFMRTKFEEYDVKYYRHKGADAFV